MSSVAIVAIPKEDEPVWKVSSEKVPHMTLLFLEGPLSNEPNTIQFIEHAVKTSLCRFGMSVDRRGVLGEDNADVLFFDKRYGFTELIDFRAYLLSNTSIMSAYRKADQYPTWTPHLTLGYPATPAKPNPDEWGIQWINFDRIAVWTEDYDGPEFILDRKESNEFELEAAWSAEDLSEYLAHHGVKGQKWGVRRDRGHEGQRAKTRKIARLDKKFARNAGTLATYIKIHNMAAEKANKLDIERINNKPKYKNADFNKPSKLRDEYYKEHMNAFNKRLDEAAESFGTNASGTQKLAIRLENDGNWQAVLVDVKHSSDSLFKIKVNYDGLGHITSIGDAEDDSLEQFETLELDDILVHFGVKGMHWGVRRPVDSSTGLVKGSVATAIKNGQTPRVSRAQKNANKAQARADRVKALADKHKGRPFNGLEQRNAKSLQKVANRKQKYATVRGKANDKTKDLASVALGKVKAKSPAAKRKALDEQLAKLSTKEIQELNNRIRAIQDHRKLTAQEAYRNRSSRKKVSDFLLGVKPPGGGNNSSKVKDGLAITRESLAVAKLAKSLIDDANKTKAKKGG